MKAIIKKFFQLAATLHKALKGYNFLLFFLVILNIVSGILEGIGINAIIPLFYLLNPTQSFGELDVVSQYVSSFLKFFHLPFSIKMLLILILLLFLVKALVLVAVTYINSYLATDYEKTSRQRLFKLTLAADWPYLLQQRVGHLTQILTVNTNYVAALINSLTNAMTVLVNVIIYVFLIINVSWPVAIATIFFGFFFSLIFKPLFYKSRAYSFKSNVLSKEMAHYIDENVIGVKTIKSMAVEESVFARADKYFKTIKLFQNRIAWFKSLTNVFVQPLGILFILAIFSLLYKFKLFNIGSFAVLIYAINKVFSNVQLLQNQLHSINAGFPYLKNLLDCESALNVSVEPVSGTNIFSFTDAIQFDRVEFNYGAGNAVISDLTFSIPKGQIVGLVGPSGSGKTTIVDLLLRLYKQQSGKIFLDGVDIHTINLKEWRQNFGYVSQDIFLMNDTIENNLRFYDSSLSIERIIEATKVAYIYDFIMSLPDGFQTMVGERGIRLSGGERQRVILARVLARNPKLLILDEATSSLDTESEQLIQKAIENLRGTTTIFIIAHRLSTLRNADHIIAIEKGKVVEQGAPNVLLNNPKTYFYRTYHLATDHRVS